MPRPQPSNRTGNGALQRLFVDREEPIAEFQRVLDELTQDSSDLLVFHGVGGQGKTSLCHELIRRARLLERPGLAIAHVDLHTRKDINPALALLWVRNALAAGSKKSFPAFDVGYAMYWRSCYPEMPLPDFGASGWLAHTEDLAADVFSEGAQEALETLAKGLLESVPFGALLRLGVGQGIEKVKLKLIYKRNPILNELADAEGNPLPPLEIERRLPDLLAWDIGRHAQSGSRFVIFIDEYERVLEQGGIASVLHRNLFDDAIRQLAARARATLFVIFSRERLPWASQPAGGIDANEWTEWIGRAHHQLGGLAPEDADRVLSAIPVEVPQIRAAMIEGSTVGTAGHRSEAYPLMLELQADHYLRLRKNPQYHPSPEDFRLQAASFAELRMQLLQRLLRDYGPQTEALLKRLAVARSFDRRLFMFLERELPSGFPLDGFNTIVQLSFVEEGPATEPDYVFHRIIREGLLEFSTPEDMHDTHAALFRFHAAAAQVPAGSPVGPEHVDALVEAAYHKLSCDREGVIDWWKNARAPFLEQHAARPLLAVEALLLEKLDPDPRFTDRARVDLLGLHVDTLLAISHFEGAIRVLTRLVEVLRSLASEGLSDLTQRLLLQSALLTRENRLLEAELASDEAYDLVDQLDPDAALDANTNFYGTLALGLERQGLFEEAEKARRLSIGFEIKKYGEHHFEVMRSRLLLAQLLAQRERDSEAQSELAQVVAFTEDATLGAIARVELLMGVAHLYDTFLGNEAEAKRCSALALAVIAGLPPDDESRTRREMLSAVVDAHRIAGNTAAAIAGVQEHIEIVRRKPGHARADLAELLLDLVFLTFQEDQLEITSAALAEAEQLIQEEGGVSRELVMLFLLAKLSVLTSRAELITGWMGGQMLTETAVREGWQALLAALINSGGRMLFIQMMQTGLERIRERTGEEDDLVVIGSLGLGIQLAQAGRFAEAETLLTAGYARLRQHFGAGHPNTIDTLVSTINCLRVLDKAEATLPLLSDLRRFADQHASDTNPPLNYFLAQTTFAEQAMITGEYDAGIELCNEALAQLERLYGTDNAFWGGLFTNRTVLLAARGRATLADLDKAAAIALNTYGIGHPLTLHTHTFLAEMHAAEKHHGSAFEARWVQVQCLHQLGGSREANTRAALAKLADHARGLGRYLEARRWYRKAMRGLQLDTAETVAWWTTTSYEYGKILLSCGEFTEAASVFQSIQVLPTELLAEDTWGRVFAMLFGARARAALGQHDAARTELEALLAKLRAFGLGENWFAVGALATLGEVEAEQGRHTLGLTCLEQALEIASRNLPEPENAWIPDDLYIRREQVRAQANHESFDLSTLQTAMDRFIAFCGQNHPAANSRRIDFAEILARRGYATRSREVLAETLTILRDCCGSPGGFASRIAHIRSLSHLEPA